MSILTEEEILDVGKAIANKVDAYDDGLQLARAIESAVLAKLAGMELPEHVYRAIQSTFDGSFMGGGKPNWDKSELDDPWIAAGRAVVTNLYTATQLHQAYAQGAASVLSAEPVGFIRKWAFDGEKPVKEKNGNGRLAWPFKFKLLPVTQGRCLKDDLPLYTLKEAK